MAIQSWLDRNRSRPDRHLVQLVSATEHSEQGDVQSWQMLLMPSEPVGHVAMQLSPSRFKLRHDVQLFMLPAQF